MFLPGSNVAVNTQDPKEVFTVTEKIGQGSYGAVYRGIDKRDGKECALKLLEYDKESIRDIQTEVGILKDCRSPYIVGLRDVFVRGRTIWIAMDYCAAGSLADMMTICRRTLSEAQIQAAMQMSLMGLDYLHGLGIIHRDIKAANVLVTDEGECKLADFGVSSQVKTTLSRKQTVIGTPNWMAPEVISESAYDTRADIWSLGIVAIELAVGEPPHSDVHPMTAMFKIPTNPPPTLPTPEKYSAHFHTFLRAALMKEPAMRPTCKQLLTHPFITSAPDKSVIMELVDQCMTEMKSYRDIDDMPIAGQTVSFQ